MSEVLEPDHLRLAEIQIDPAFQNMGIGTALLLDLLGRAKALQKPVRLSVLRGSRAGTLYQRLGLRCYGETETHLLYGTGAKDSNAV